MHCLYYLKRCIAVGMLSFFLLRKFDVFLNGKEFTISTCQQLAVERSLMWLFLFPPCFNGFKSPFFVYDFSQTFVDVKLHYVCNCFSLHIESLGIKMVHMQHDFIWPNSTANNSRSFKTVMAMFFQHFFSNTHHIKCDK